MGKVVNLKPKDLSQVSIEWINNWWHKISKHLKEGHLKAISNHLGITKELAKEAILTSLEKLGWEYDNDLKEHHIFWLSLIRACIDEKDPFKRWERTKSLICEAIKKWYSNNLIYGTYEIIRDLRIPTEASLQKSSVILQITEPSFVEYCLRTIILFNAQNKG